MPTILVLGEQRQEDQKFEVTFAYRESWSHRRELHETLSDKPTSKVRKGGK